MNTLLKCFLALSVSLLLFSCGGDNSKDKSNENVEIAESLNIGLNSKVLGFDPIKILDVYSSQVLEQIYEGLVKFNSQTLEIEPQIAESWSIDESGLIYTFKIRKGIYFHDNKCFSDGKGRELDASDIKNNFDRLCNSQSNYAYSLIKTMLNGATQSFQTKEFKEVSGIKIIDKYTISFTLVSPTLNFLPALATVSLAIVPKEAYSIVPMEIVGSGPFIFEKSFYNDSNITLKRNPNYYVLDSIGDKLPYLEAVTFHFVESNQNRLDLFDAGKLDMIIDLPSASIKNVVENQISDFQSKPPKYVLGRYAELATTYLEFNTKIAPFDNKKIRQAIAMTIDKSKLVDGVLNGEAFGPSYHGINPPIINNYDYESVIGIEYNIEKAKKLLAEAGYKDGLGLDMIKFYIKSNDNQSLRVALEIQKQLLTSINVNTEIILLSFAEMLDMNNFAKGSMSISTWAADFPTPDNFLSIGYGAYVPNNINESSFPNASRYVSADFDKFYEKAITTNNESLRNENCLKAEQILINDAPIIPLWYNENYRLFQSKIANYRPNVMKIHDLRSVRIIKQEQKISK